MRAAEVLPGDPDAPVVLTCEHASAALPAPWAPWRPGDLWLASTHWASDLGIGPITRALAGRLRAPAVLAGFSRLLVDPNRPPGHPDLIREWADGLRVELNSGLSERDRAQRMAKLYGPYHGTVDRVVAESRAQLVLSMHSFTPVYEGEVRSLEVGVLFDRDPTLAAAFADRLGAAGLTVGLNEPYSGKEGLIYAVDAHATAHGRAALELEIRQDLATDPVRARQLVDLVAAAVVGLTD